jgi:hypothetical protein
MAIVLSSSLSSTLEPLRKNRWIVQFTTAPGATGTDPTGKLAFAAHTCARPTLTFGEVEQHRLNERFYVAGKPSWNALPMSFYDYIEGLGCVSHILWEWANSIYNPITGQMFFKTQYMTSGTLAMLDPAGGVVQVWNLFYIWPQEVAWNDLSSEDEGLVETNANFRYDYAVKGTDVDTSPTNEGST